MKVIQWDGSPITEPGIYSGIDLDFYHSPKICADGYSVSSSNLRTIISESPAHFFCHWRGNPNRVEEPVSPASIVGRAAHHLFLGEKFFTEKFAVQPEDYESEDGEIKKWHNAAKACKEWREIQNEAGRLILTAGDFEDIKGMAIQLGKHWIAKVGALNGLIEHSIFWKDKKTGIWLKARPDTIPGDSGDFVDYKTTTSVQWHSCQKSIADFNYHMQGAIVLRGAREVLDVPDPSFTLVWQEKTPPYCIRVTQLKDNMLAEGDRANRIALDTFARCLKSGHWPGPGGEREDAEPIEMSEAAQQRFADRLTIMGA